MRASTKPLLALTAGELMTADVVRLTEAMPLREAARLLLEQQVSGAPVVNQAGKCVGVFSTTDLLRFAIKRADVTQPLAPPQPITCSFQRKHRTPEGEEVTRCTLPPGVCPLQVRRTTSDRQELLVCRDPHCVLTDWQVVEMEQLPADEVRRFMTADLVTVSPATPLPALARMMIDAHIHRVIVVDEVGAPVGVVSTTDILAAVAYAGAE